MSLLVDLIPIGTELMLGRIEDTNTRFLSDAITGMGGCVRRVITVRDDARDIADVVRESVASEASYIITTGGLGPTPDPLTVSVLSELMGCGTLVDEGLLSNFQEKLQAKGVNEISNHMRKVATIPDIGRAAPNRLGWGHCITIDWCATTLFVLPGPPQEVSALFGAYIEPEFREAVNSDRCAT